jgi:hypothetical protein
MDQMKFSFLHINAGNIVLTRQKKSTNNSLQISLGDEELKIQESEYML